MITLERRQLDLKYLTRRVLDRNTSNELEKALKHRKRYDYSTCDFLYNFLWCIKFRCPCKKNKLTIYDKYKFYKTGSEKLVKELDITEMLTSIRELKATVDWMMTDNQRSLVKFHKNYIINLDEPNTQNHKLRRIPTFRANMMATEEHFRTVDKLIRSYHNVELSPHGKSLGDIINPI